MILSAYSVISRGRQYAGMAASPLPLSLSDINTYLCSKPLRINRELFEQAIFALDDVHRSEMAESNDEDKDEDE